MISYETLKIDNASFLKLLSRPNNTPSMRREVLEAIDMIAKKSSKEPMSFNEYSTYLTNVHDILIRSDTTIRSQLIRLIRYGLVSPVHGEEIILQVYIYSKYILFIVFIYL